MCLGECVVYQATIVTEDDRPDESYVGLTEGTFKSRYLNHTSSFRNENKKTATELSKYIWTLKNHNVNYSVTWKILKKCKPYSTKSKICNLCLHEKYLIICHLELSSTNLSQPTAIEKNIHCVKSRLYFNNYIYNNHLSRPLYF